MNLNKKAVDYLQVLSAKIICNAKSGHTGVALGASSIFYALFKDHFKFDIAGQNINRDRFVVSAGHASALYYATMHLFGFDVSMDDLKKFRQIGSKTPGHPEVNTITGVDCSTGPLGQGIANAVGLAIASRHYAQNFNVQNFDIISNTIYCFCGDGCLMEGVAQEAISLAGNLGLDNLIVLYDCNKITIDGKIDITNTENVKLKFLAQNWDAIEVKNGNDYKCVSKAIKKAKSKKGKPKVVICNTKIGFNSIYEDSNKIHGKPLTDAEYSLLKNKLNILEDFFIPAEIYEFCQQRTAQNNQYFEDWNQKFCLYGTTHPELYKKYLQFSTLPVLHKEKLSKIFVQDKYAGRVANGMLFKELTAKIPSILGGCADLANSTNVIAEGSTIISHDFRGTNINFGVREHGMAAICNGISLFNNNISFCSTFLAFSNYLLPAVKMSCLMNLKVWYIFTHDNITVGEDGPTHQPVEQLGQLRLYPNLKVFRPCDFIELVDCYKIALEHNGPCAFVLSKSEQTRYSTENKALSGVQTICAEPKPDLTLLSTGTDIELCVQAKKILNKKYNIDIVSVPCFSMFDNLKTNTKNAYLKGTIIAVESSNDNCWYKYTQHVFNIKTYGKSGKGSDVAKYMGWTPQHLAKYIKDVCEK